MRPLVEKPPTLNESLGLLLQIPADISLIRDKENIGLTGLARTFRVAKETVWSWGKGYSLPKEPLITLSIISWAKKLRERSVNSLPQILGPQ